MKIWRIIFMMLAAFSLVSCGSDEPRYADPEAHEKTVQLNEQYGPLMVGTWHYENISDTQRYFERLTFQGDGTLTGMRKWQTRKLVTIDGEQRYTDWENVEPLEGTFSGTWPIPISPPSTTPTKRRFDSKDFTSKTRMDGLPSFVARQNRDSERNNYEKYILDCPFPDTMSVQKWTLYFMPLLIISKLRTWHGYCIVY